MLVSDIDILRFSRREDGTKNNFPRRFFFKITLVFADKLII
jgi:hypothetical protein